MRNKNIVLAQTAGVGLALALAVFACGCGGGSSGGGTQQPPADTIAPTISAASALPASIAPVSEKVTIQAAVTDDVGVSSVTAVVTKPDSTTETVTLAGSGGVYSVQYPAASNLQLAAGNYTVVVTAKDAANNPKTAGVTFAVEGPPNPPATP